MYNNGIELIRIYEFGKNLPNHMQQALSMKKIFPTIREVIEIGEENKMQKLGCYSTELKLRRGRIIVN